MKKSDESPKVEIEKGMKLGILSTWVYQIWIFHLDDHGISIFLTFASTPGLTLYSSSSMQLNSTTKPRFGPIQRLLVLSRSQICEKLWFSSQSSLHLFIDISIYINLCVCHHNEKNSLSRISMVMYSCVYDRGTRFESHVCNIFN